MPHYEFFCRACKKNFSKILALVDYEEGGVVCPHCGSYEVEQRWSAFSVVTPKKVRERTSEFSRCVAP
jgi:putative FmdB family regulatory protein